MTAARVADYQKSRDVRVTIDIMVSDAIVFLLPKKSLAFSLILDSIHIFHSTF